jgi:hypothetical protein
MSWDPTDRYTYNTAISLNVGQINMNTKFGFFIYSVAKNKNFKTFLEVGTWNGLGSTKCFVEGFKQRNDDFKFYSLECNSDKSKFAADLYKDEPNVYILNQTLLTQDDYKDAGKVFPNMAMNWYKNDMDNIKTCKNFLSENNIDNFDVVLLDGGEYTTYFEFQKIRDKCSIIMLDDTNTDKCRQIVVELKNDTNWKLMVEDDEHNGFAIFKKHYINDF